MEETKIIAGITGLIGVIGLLWLFLNRRSRSKSRSASRNYTHVEADETMNRQTFHEMTPEKIIYKYLYHKYWRKQNPDMIENIPEPVTCRDFKQVSRVSCSNPPILIIYGKKSVWQLGLCNDAEKGLNERFYFVLRGPKLFSKVERAEKLDFVMLDLIEFRKVGVSLWFYFDLFTFLIC